MSLTYTPFIVEKDFDADCNDHINQDADVIIISSDSDSDNELNHQCCECKTNLDGRKLVKYDNCPLEFCNNCWHPINSKCCLDRKPFLEYVERKVSELNNCPIDYDEWAHETEDKLQRLISRCLLTENFSPDILKQMAKLVLSVWDTNMKFERQYG